MFTKIYDKTYQELTFEEVVKFLTERTFFLFMDRGRGGIEQAAQDIVNTMGQFMIVKNVSKRFGKMDNVNDLLTQDQYRRLTAMISLDLVDTAITEGFRKLSANITQVPTLIINIRETA